VRLLKVSMDNDIRVLVSPHGLRMKINFREFSCWILDSNLISNISCLGHVVNLAEVDVMAHITKIAAMETTTAIWEYDPSLPTNRVLNGSLDVIAAIRTLAIKVC
jgi:hypothetical protein